MKKVIIIGSGIAGLSAGCYLQMNGYESAIYEKHSISGGLCTSWKRNGYTFDGCIHWLLGSAKGNTFYKLWSELIDMNHMEFIHHSTRVSIEVSKTADRYGNKVFHLYSKTDELEQYLLDLSPEDNEPIRDFIEAIEHLGRYELPPLADKAPQVRTFSDYIKMISYLPLIKFIAKWSKISNVDYAKKFKSPFLKEAFELMFDGLEYTILMMMMQLSFFNTGCAAYPKGGSLVFARQIEERYYKLGGKIIFNTSVSKIITENDTAVAIQTGDDQIISADLVISAADWNYTVYEALSGKYTDHVITSLKNQQLLKVFESAFLISLGVSGLYDDLPHLLRFPLKEVLKFEDGAEYERMEVHIYNYDKSLYPEGKTSMTVTLTTKKADFWIELRKNDFQKYQEMKNEIAKHVINILDEKLGNLTNNIEVVDVATPATFFRYTGNWKGSMQGWMPSDKLLADSPVKNTLPGLKNFYMTGQWIVPGGGLPIALQTSRNLVQILCKKDKKVFKV